VGVYDRAGRGWSEPASTAQDGAQIVTDLHRLLQRGHVPGPYVLAGHSFGDYFGRTVNLAARIAAHAAAGQVLVSQRVAESGPPEGVRLVELGELELKGFTRPVRLLEARRT